MSAPDPSLTRQSAGGFIWPVAPVFALCCLIGAAASAGCASTAARPAAGPHAGASPAGAAPRPFEDAFSPEQARRIQAMQPHVHTAATRYDLDPSLINAVIWVESRFVPDAKSPAGARGLMQLMPATAAGLAKQLGERRPRSYDPAFNVGAGSYYLRRLLDRFDGDLELALASYNAGAGNVRKWMDSGDGLPDHSRDYVAKVLEARARFEGTPLVPTPPPPKLAPPVAPPTSAGVLAERGPSEPAAEPELPPTTPTLPVEANGPADPEAFEPVFEPHPELDAHPESAAPATPAPPQPEGPEGMGPAPSPAPSPSPDVGAGVLPGVGD